MKENTIIVTQQPCPKCGKLNRFKMSQNVNGESDKIMAIHTLNGDIFFYRCDSCGFRTYIAYPVIYRNLKKRVYILYSYDKAWLYQQRENFKKMKVDPHYKERLKGVKLHTHCDLENFMDKVAYYEDDLPFDSPIDYDKWIES